MYIDSYNHYTIMTIKHIVISGGGPTGLKALGALQHLEQHGFWNINDIISIYATSAGAIVAILLALKFDWSSITDYIIKRPWHDAYPFGVDQVFEAYSKKGLFDNSIFEIFFKSVFNAKDVSMYITMQEFYKYSKIELHFFTLELNKFEIVDISYKSHPELSLITAVHMSCALPMVVTPVCIDQQCFVDGGVTSNYPLCYCLQQYPNVDEILGLRNAYENSHHNIVNNESNILDYAMNFINTLIFNVDTEFKQITIQNEIDYKTIHMNLSYIRTAVSSQEVRQQLFDDGLNVAIEFLAANSEKKGDNEGKNKNKEEKDDNPQEQEQCL